MDLNDRRSMNRLSYSDVDVKKFFNDLDICLRMQRNSRCGETTAGLRIPTPVSGNRSSNMRKTSSMVFVIASSQSAVSLSQVQFRYSEIERLFLGCDSNRAPDSRSYNLSKNTELFLSIILIVIRLIILSFNRQLLNVVTSNLSQRTA